MVDRRLGSIVPCDRGECGCLQSCKTCPPCIGPSCKPGNRLADCFIPHVFGDLHTTSGQAAGEPLRPVDVTFKEGELVCMIDGIEVQYERSTHLFLMLLIPCFRSLQPALLPVEGAEDQACVGEGVIAALLLPMEVPGKLYCHSDRHQIIPRPWRTLLQVEVFQG
ncbi:hypothetical protein DSECCO2_535790 [anaerobic digester metagenome]